MIPHVEDCYFWKRENNVLIACTTHGEEIPLVKFTFSKFIDVTILSKQGGEYMERYVAMFPQYCEILYPPKEQKQQLTLF